MSRKTTAHHTKKSPPVSGVDQSGKLEFETIVEKFLSERDIVAARMFGSPGLR